MSFTNNDKSGNGPTLSTPIAITLILFAAVVIIVLAGLVYTGKDVGQLSYIILAFVPVALGQVINVARTEKLIDKTDAQNEVLSTVSKAVNGNLDRKFAELTDHVTEQTSIIPTQAAAADAETGVKTNE